MPLRARTNMHHIFRTIPVVHNPALPPAVRIRRRSHRHVERPLPRRRRRRRFSIAREPTNAAIVVGADAASFPPRRDRREQRREVERREEQSQPRRRRQELRCSPHLLSCVHICSTKIVCYFECYFLFFLSELQVNPINECINKRKDAC